MSSRGVKRAAKKRPAGERTPASPARPDAPLHEADLDNVVGGVQRQAPNTNFGAIVREGMSTAKEPK
jgi:hypothetical protein